MAIAVADLAEMQEEISRAGFLRRLFAIGAGIAASGSIVRAIESLGPIPSGRPKGPQSQHKASEPLRAAERLEWARVALEEAVGRMATHPAEQLYVWAVIARYNEMLDIKAAVLKR